MGWEDKVIEPRHSDRPSNKYNAYIFIELLKVIHCLDLEEFTEMMNPPSLMVEDSAFGYADMKRNMLDWLCTLNPDTQGKVFEYAEKKRIWWELKRSK